MGIPLTKTVALLVVTEGLGGKQSCPEQDTPRKAIAAIDYAPLF
jgi:hypothetical protein